MKAILFNSDASHTNYVYSAEIKQRLFEAIGVEPISYSLNDVKANPEKFKEVKYIFSTWGMIALSEEEIKTYFPSLECVFYAAGTVQAFARPFLNLGVKVFSAWAANAVPVAEFTVAQIILSNKGMFRLSRIYKQEGHKSAVDAVSGYIGNYGAKVGIIGAGMIGKLVIKLLKQYNLECLVFDPFLSDADAEKIGVKKCSLEELFSLCEIVSNHLANNEQTKGMLKYDLFKLMKPNSTFINTGRGAQVVEDDLVRILNERSDITALLDVTEPEPPVDNHHFYSLDNCILTPHIAGSSGDEVHRMAEYMFEEYHRYVGGEKPLYEVTHKMLETMA